MDAAIADSLTSPGFSRLCTMASDESNSMAWSGSDANVNKECNNNNLSQQHSFCATNLMATSRPVPGLTMCITQPSSFVSISPIRKSSRGGGGPYIWTSPIRYLSTPTSLPPLTNKNANAKPTRTASTWAQVCAATAADAVADELFVKLQERFAHIMKSSKSIAAKAKKSKPATVVKAKKSKAKQGINTPSSKVTKVIKSKGNGRVYLVVNNKRAEIPSGLDVLGGRGQTKNMHEGNVLFRNEVSKLRSVYQDGENGEKKMLVEVSIRLNEAVISNDHLSSLNVLFILLSNRSW